MKSRLNKKPNDETGSALIQVLVATTISSIVALSLASIVTQSNQEAALIQAKVESVNLAGDIRVQLLNSQSCRALLGTLQIPPAHFTQAAAKQELQVLNIGNLVVKNNEINEQYNVKITNINLTNFESLGSAGGTNLLVAADLIYTAASAAQSQPGIPLRQFRPIKAGRVLMVAENTGNIVDCFGEESREGILRDVCLSQGGRFDVTTEQCDMSSVAANICAGVGGTYDLTKKICIPGTPKFPCGPAPMPQASSLKKVSGRFSSKTIYGPANNAETFCSGPKPVTSAITPTALGNTINCSNGYVIMLDQSKENSSTSPTLADYFCNPPDSMPAGVRCQKTTSSQDSAGGPVPGANGWINSSTTQTQVCVQGQWVEMSSTDTQYSPPERDLRGENSGSNL